MEEVDTGAQLVTTLLLMFFGALVAGSLPFFMRVREAHLQTMAALGGGLLIGSALAVIVPEGFHAFGRALEAAHPHHEEAAHDGHHHAHGEEGLPEGVAGLVLVGGFLAMLLLDHLQHAAGGGHGHSHGHTHSHSHGAAVCGSTSQDRLKQPAAATGAAAAVGGRPVTPTSAGAAAAAGFTAAAAAASSAAGGDGECQAAEADCSGKAKAAATAASATDPQGAITGLIIHCAADGLAMGAAFLSGNARLSMIIAAAMVLHKAPMAFGLSTYLMSCHWTWQRSQKTLLVFSAAAPVATVVTYTLLGSISVLSSPAAVALCVIFSGGTFLYAATMHILPEVLSGGSGHMSGAQLIAVTLGSLLPAILSWGHKH